MSRIRAMGKAGVRFPFLAPVPLGACARLRSMVHAEKMAFVGVVQVDSEAVQVNGELGFFLFGLCCRGGLCRFTVGKQKPSGARRRQPTGRHRGSRKCSLDFLAGSCSCVWFVPPWHTRNCNFQTEKFRTEAIVSTGVPE